MEILNIVSYALKHFVIQQMHKYIIRIIIKYLKIFKILNITTVPRDHGSTVVKVLCYKSRGHWFNTSWCQWTFH